MSVKLGEAFERGPSTCGKALLEKNKKGVSNLNTVEALGINLLRVMRPSTSTAGTDLVHPSAAAYRLLAAKITARIDKILT
jgi:lysophospholipase L1-like esterase